MISESLPAAVKAVVARRRTLKPAQFTDETIPDNLIEEMLEAARWAPSHGLTEPWFFTVFCGEGRQRLAHIQAELYIKHTPPDKFNAEREQNLRQMALRSSHIISLGMRRSPLGKIPAQEEVEAVACAADNILLTATAHGIGSFWSTGGAVNFAEARPFFGLAGPEDQLLGLIYLGYPAVPWPEGRRAALTEKMRWVRE